MARRGGWAIASFKGEKITKHFMAMEISFIVCLSKA